MCRTNMPMARFVRTSPTFNWSKIIKNFEIEFKKTFTVDRKAHFDCLPDEFSVVDGAKAHWCILLLLDAVIFILKNDGFSQFTRRAFNQHQVLYDCIMSELKAVDVKSFDVISQEKRALVSPNDHNKEVAGKYSNISLVILEAAWQSMEELESQLVSECPASKAKAKFPIVVRLLTRHECFTQLGSNLHAILRLVVSRALFAFNPERPLAKKERAHKVKLMDALQEYRQARRQSLLELVAQRVLDRSTAQPPNGSLAVVTPPALPSPRSNGKTKFQSHTHPDCCRPRQQPRVHSPLRNNNNVAQAAVPVDSAQVEDCVSRPGPCFDSADFDRLLEGFDFGAADGEYGEDDLFGSCCCGGAGVAPAGPPLTPPTEDHYQQQQQQQQQQYISISSGNGILPLLHVVSSASGSRDESPRSSSEGSFELMTRNDASSQKGISLSDNSCDNSLDGSCDAADSEDTASLYDFLFPIIMDEGDDEGDEQMLLSETHWQKDSTIASSR